MDDGRIVDVVLVTARLKMIHNLKVEWHGRNSSPLSEDAAAAAEFVIHCMLLADGWRRSNVIGSGSSNRSKWNFSNNKRKLPSNQIGDEAASARCLVFIAFSTSSQEKEATKKTHKTRPVKTSQPHQHSMPRYSTFVDSHSSSSSSSAEALSPSQNAKNRCQHI